MAGCARRWWPTWAGWESCRPGRSGLAAYGSSRDRRPDRVQILVGVLMNRYIVCYNPAEAERDRQAREELIKKLQEKLARGGKELIGHRSYRGYLDLAGTTIRLKQEVLEEAQYDGKYVLRTNAGLDTAETVQAYKDLWRVERAFRELKSTLDLRPIYHWQDRRVRGHVMVCFLGLVLASAGRPFCGQKLDRTFAI